MSDVTHILSQIESGHPKAAEQLLPLVYHELRKLAAARLAQENPGQTLQATALVHEAYLRLVHVNQAQTWETRGHFFAAAAEAMRRILVEAARRKQRLKRGRDHQRLSLDHVELSIAEPGEDLLALDEALEKLEAKHPERAALVKLRYFDHLERDLAVHGVVVPVCQAIQHAHQKGIIHRDIKPSNVMVTLYDGKPVPKVIDFGVAKATEQKLTERTLFTQYGTLVGTLEYMSPEQAEMSALGVDTRSDIYSLGVLLYELLTSTTPFDKERLRTASYDEIRRIIREEEPVRPSTRISTLAQAATTAPAERRSDLRQLRRLVRGELDWIVMKALEKERNRRYETANSLAIDIQRHMNNEPILARSPSAMYKFRKFVRRNRSPVMAAAALLLVLCLGLVGTSLGLVRARTEALLARLAQDAATQERDSANAARQREAEARLDQQRLNFHMAFDRGLALCDQGQVGSGMLWLARALKLAPRDEAAIEGVIRANLTAWRRELHTLQAIYPYKQGVSTGTISPDGALVLTGAIDGVVHLWDRRTGKGR